MFNKKNAVSVILATALVFVATVPGFAQEVTPQHPTKEAPAPPSTPSQAPDINGIDLGAFLQMMQAAHQPTPQDFEGVYTQAWLEIAQHYHNLDALKNWGDWLHKYDGKLNSRQDLDAALKAMVGSLNDQWTKYVSPSDMKAAAKASHEGTVSSGIWVKRNDSGVPVIQYLEGGSVGYVSVLKVGDEVVSINGTSLVGLTDSAISDLLLGKPGSIVEIAYKHAGQDGKVRLMLAEEHEQAPEVAMLPGNIMYFRLPEFSSENVETMQEKSAELIKGWEKPASGIILDLRGNPGGLENMAIEVTSMFLEKGIVLSTEQRDGREINSIVKKVIPTPPLMLVDADEKDLATLDAMMHAPMVVLVDGSSASASEIVAAALKDNHRATLIGTRTWGKGVAYVEQRLFNGGGLRITMADLRSPDGFDWHGKGITPDKVVERALDSNLDNQLFAAIAHLQSQINK